jgi:uncharacterized MAPEG superfamily protein
MTTGLTAELYWLTLTSLMTALFWVPYILNRIVEYGPRDALLDPSGRTETRVKWADRMMRAHRNAVENLVIFAPLVLVLHASGISNTVTVTACAVYFYARLAHYLIYSFGIPGLRTAAFAVGFGAQMVLALQLLQAA